MRQKIRNKKSYCSSRCFGLDHKISKDFLLNQVLAASKALGRVPTGREFRYKYACARHFGSWNNAIVAAGLTPYRSLSQRMYKRRNCKAIDGHLCNSVSELLIDNWLTKHHIGHAKEVPYPVGKYKTDWMLNQNTYIEYFGLAKDSKRYDADIKVKQSLCKKYKINLIEIYAKDLFPINLLHNKLKVIKSSQ